MGAEGRWTVHYVAKPVAGHVGNAYVTGPYFSLPSTPVVPCDDAAVERVARWLHEVRFGCTGEAPCDSCRGDAGAVLRAAGAADAS